MFEGLIPWRSARNVTPPYEWVVAGRLVTNRVAQGDDLGDFNSKRSVYQRERKTEICKRSLFLRATYPTKTFTKFTNRRKGKREAHRW